MREKMDKLKVDHLQVKIVTSREVLGRFAAKDVVNKVKELLQEQEEVNMIFAAAPSQNEFLAELVKEENIAWNRVNAFHMDEYLGLEETHPRRFGNFLKKRIFERVPFKQVFYLNEKNGPVKDEIENYVKLLESYPVDIVCMGIGENTHIAFNDPHVADFEDPFMVKEVELDPISRQQQVHDGCFPDLEKVPLSALTLTIPALMKAKYIYCMVPGRHKAKAVKQTLMKEISERYPASSLRHHPAATLYLDQESANLIKTS